MSTRHSGNLILETIKDVHASLVAESGRRPEVALLDHMAQRLDVARDALMRCFPTSSRPTLAAVRNDGLNIQVGPARTLGDGDTEEFRHGDNGPIQFNVFNDRGANGLLWMTSIGVGDFESVEIEADREGWCANRLAFCLERHADMIERDIKAVSAKNLDGPDLTWTSLSAPPSAFLYVRATNIRGKYFAAYMQVQTFWHPAL